MVKYTLNFKYFWYYIELERIRETMNIVFNFNIVSAVITQLLSLREQVAMR